MKYLNKIFLIALFLILTSFQIFSQSNKPYARNINITVENDSINISWENLFSNDIKQIYLYKANKPIIFQNQLTKENLVTTLDAKQDFYTIYDKKDFANYYALIYQLKDNSFYDVLIFSENSSVFNAVLEAFIQKTNYNLEEDVKQLTEETLEEGKLRKTPLPTISLFEDDYSLAKSQNNTTKIDIKPYIFEEEKEENPVGLAYELYNITSKYFSTEDFEGASKELKFLLENKYDEKTTARIYFYLGECYFFNQDYKNALSCFLLSEKQYPTVSKQWQQYVLTIFSF